MGRDKGSIQIGGAAGGVPVWIIGVPEKLSKAARIGQLLSKGAARRSGRAPTNR
jgi:hypothetical protein